MKAAWQLGHCSDVNAIGVICVYNIVCCFQIIPSSMTFFFFATTELFEHLPSFCHCKSTSRVLCFSPWLPLFSLLHLHSYFAFVTLPVSTLFKRSKSTPISRTSKASIKLCFFSYLSSLAQWLCRNFTHALILCQFIKGKKITLAVT